MGKQRRRKQDDWQRRQIYLRLVPLMGNTASVVVQLEQVSIAIDQLDDVQWQTPPQIHPRGGFWVHISLPEPIDGTLLGTHFESHGYAVAF